MLLVVNGKLVDLVRHLTRGGLVRRQRPEDFWLGRPRLLLWVMKFALFMLALTLSLNVFFAFHFTKDSCYFTAYRHFFLVTLVVDVLMLTYLGLVSLPLYSLVVQLHGAANADGLQRYFKLMHVGEALPTLEGALEEEGGELPRDRPGKE